MTRPSARGLFPVAAALLLLLGSPGTGRSQTPDTRGPSPPSATEPETPASPAVEEPSDEGNEKGARASTESQEASNRNPCDVPSDPDEALLDRMRRGVFETVCGSAQWFDEFFGDRRFDEEARKTHGRLRLLTVYDEFEGFDAKIRLRAEVNFPNLDRRVNAFLGREDEEEFLRGDDTAFGEFLPDFFREAEDQDWLLGLGYSPVGTARQKFELDAGVEVRTPLEPFVRGQYRRYWVFGGQHLVRFRESVYWRNQRGVGTSGSLDVERVVGTNKLLRWEGRASIDEATEGVEWRSAVILYQGFGEDKALAYRFAWDGETDHDVPVRRFGPQVTYRQQMFREWFYGEIVAGVTWPKEEIGQDRDASFNIGFGAEIRFGNEPD